MQMWKAKNASHIRTASTAAEYFNAKPKPTFTQKIGHYLPFTTFRVRMTRLFDPQVSLSTGQVLIEPEYRRKKARR
jgi:hypothetical protein